MARTRFALDAGRGAGMACDRQEALDRKELRTEPREGMMVDSDAIKRLLERLQTGWAPQADEMEPAVPQVDALNWQWNFEDAGTIVPRRLTGSCARRPVFSTSTST